VRSLLTKLEELGTADRSPSARKLDTRALADLVAEVRVDDASL
jgi:hypothetical protein